MGDIRIEIRQGIGLHDHAQRDQVDSRIVGRVVRLDGGDELRLQLVPGEGLERHVDARALPELRLDLLDRDLADATPFRRLRNDQCVMDCPAKSTISLGRRRHRETEACQRAERSSRLEKATARHVDLSHLRLPSYLIRSVGSGLRLDMASNVHARLLLRRHAFDGRPNAFVLAACPSRRAGPPVKARRLPQADAVGARPDRRAGKGLDRGRTVVERAVVHVVGPEADDQLRLVADARAGGFGLIPDLLWRTCFRTGPSCPGSGEPRPRDRVLTQVGQSANEPRSEFVGAFSGSHQGKGSRICSIDRTRTATVAFRAFATSRAERMNSVTCSARKAIHSGSSFGSSRRVPPCRLRGRRPASAPRSRRCRRRIRRPPCRTSRTAPAAVEGLGLAIKVEQHSVEPVGELFVQDRELVLPHLLGGEAHLRVPRPAIPRRDPKLRVLGCELRVFV